MSRRAIRMKVDATMTFLSRAVPCLLAASLVLAAGEAPTGDFVAQRGDLRITAAQVREALSLLDPNGRAQVMASTQTLTEFVRERLLNQAVLAEARSKGWDARPEVALRAAEARDAVVLQAYLGSFVPPDPAFPAEAEVEAAYESNKLRLVVPKQYHLSQIVVLVRPDASAKDDDDARKKIVDLRNQAVRAKADFADLARKNSQEKPSADKGGDVGWLRETDMLQAVREAVSGLPEYGVSVPVRVPDGWHLLKLMEVKPAGPVSLADAKPQLVAALRQARAQKMMRDYVTNMVKAQPIQVNEIELNKQLGGAN